MRSLRSRLFAATLAALALTLALTIAIGAVLTRRQVDRTQASNVARRADDLALQRRQSVSYRTEDVLSAGVRIMIQSRAKFASIVPDVNRSSDGTTTYLGERQLYSYRTLPHLGLLLMRPASLQSAAWRPFLSDLLFAALAGAIFAAVVSFVLARSIVRPLRRVADATHAIAAGEEHEPLPTTGSSELAALADGVQPDGRGPRRFARGRAGIPALGQPRAEDAADRDPGLRGRARRRRVRARRGRTHDRRRGGPARAARPRPARPGAHEPRRVLRAQRAGRPRRRRA